MRLTRNSHYPRPAAVLSRRRLLGAATALTATALIPWSPGSAAAQAAPDGFLALSQELTGQSDLSADLAEAMLEDFQAAGQGDAIAALVDGEDNADLENAIVASWYSGMSPNPDSATVVTYTEALMWSAMSYTKPMGYCGGGVGYWADAPEA